MDHYKFVILSNAVEGREDEYNHWYDTQHIDDVLNIPGFHRAERLIVENPFSADPPPYKYMAVYEFETDDLKKTFDYFLSVTNTDRMPISAALADGAQYTVARTQPPAHVRSAPTPWPA